MQLATTLGSIRWSGLIARATTANLTDMAVNYSREYVRDRISTYGLLSRARAAASSSSSTSTRNIIPRPSVDIQDRLLDRLDPARQLERLSRFLWHRRRLAALRGEWLYFYTDLKNSGRGLAGVNINTGRTERSVPLGDPDDRFISDEEMNLLYTVKDNRLIAYALGGTP